MAPSAWLVVVTTLSTGGSVGDPAAPATEGDATTNVATLRAATARLWRRTAETRRRIRKRCPMPLYVRHGPAITTLRCDLHDTGRRRRPLRVSRRPAPARARGRCRTARTHRPGSR